MATKLVAYYNALLAIFVAASAKDRAMGLIWYPVTARPILSEGAQYGLSPYQSVAAFAALSANIRLDGNWRLFRQFIRTGHAGTVPVALQGALRAVATDGPASICAITVPHSRSFKTKAFATSIMAANGYDMGLASQYDPQAACLDRWMHRAGTGDYTLVDPPKDYAVMAEALSLVAIDAGLPIWVVQAIIWCAVQTQQGVNWLATDPTVTAYATAPLATVKPSIPVIKGA